METVKDLFGRFKIRHGIQVHHIGAFLLKELAENMFISPLFVKSSSAHI